MSSLPWSSTRSTDNSNASVKSDLSGEDDSYNIINTEILPKSALSTEEYFRTQDICTLFNILLLFSFLWEGITLRKNDMSLYLFTKLIFVHISTTIHGTSFYIFLFFQRPQSNGQSWWHIYAKVFLEKTNWLKTPIILTRKTQNTS